MNHPYASPGSSLRQRWAASLGVEKPDSPAHWLLRLFFVPAASGPAAYGWVNRLARHLGVSNPRDELEWLLRLLILPPQQAQPKQAAHPTWRLPAWLRLSLTLADRWEEWLAGLPWNKSASVLEQVAAGATDHGGLPRGLFAVLAAIAMALGATIPLSNRDQLTYALLLWLAAWLIRRMPGRLATTALVSLSALASLRYGWWRMDATLEMGFDEAALAGYILLAAESCFYLTVGREFAGHLTGSAYAGQPESSGVAADFCRGFPRLAFLCTPLAYLFFELPIIAAPAATFVLYAVPHLLLALVASARLRGETRHPIGTTLYGMIQSLAASGASAHNDSADAGPRRPGSTWRCWA
ncbi:hypothetical protein [Methylogaea oryzae]|uniref:hypothetical protein n=1 Tax=Methylogaea oryzae TaxID=1295382 RepID=UPI0006CFC705|nr:hypothetical protein [Methylogaea oryzae]